MFGGRHAEHECHSHVSALEFWLSSCFLQLKILFQNLDNEKHSFANLSGKKITTNIVICLYSFNGQAAPTYYSSGHLIFPRLESGIWKCQNSIIKYKREIIWKKANKTKVNIFIFSCLRFCLYFLSYWRLLSIKKRFYYLSLKHKWTKAVVTSVSPGLVKRIKIGGKEMKKSSAFFHVLQKRGQKLQ